MTRPPRTTIRRAAMKCNECGYVFVTTLTHEAVERVEREILDWVPTKYSTLNVFCPACNSDLIRVVR
jgi:Zn finger protein HypA/HybF involved in hydrogenase expression